MSLPSIVEAEQDVLVRVLAPLRALQEKEAAQEEALAKRLKEDHATFASHERDRAQRAVYEEALADGEIQLRAHQQANRARELGQSPYFGRLVLDEDGRSQEVLVGKVGVPDLRIADWRAPIAKLWYELEQGDDYEVTVNGRDREGVVGVRRRVDVRSGHLYEVEAPGLVLRRRPDGTWAAPKARSEEREDHRLPDIVSLITREQFAVITRPDAGVVLLRGRAGSGKTTVALHRVAYLHFQDASRFRGDRILVVMFNKALQTYISKVLPDLGLRGVQVETFHGWAGRMLRQGGITLPFRSTCPPAVARLKRHPAMERLLSEGVARLGERTAAWIAERVPPAQRADWEATPGSGLARVAAFRGKGKSPEITAAWPRMRARLLDHVKDLRAVFEDEALCAEALPKELHRAAAAAREHHLGHPDTLDWEDAALLLRLGQLKHELDRDLRCPWSRTLAHVVVDEAQDLSTVEISVLVGAADEGRSVTIAGDPAQKILADAQFEGFDALLQRLTGHVQVKLDALQVGHRSTRPIMALAVRALGHDDDPILATAREGDPVEWVEGPTPEERVAQAISAFRASRPTALVAVLAKRKNTADAWATRLQELGVADVRRAARDGFAFHPGVVVSNVHQVKGLEFDGVVLVEPSDYDRLDRHLLHVAITRAADRLWVVAGRGRGPLGDRTEPGMTRDRA